MAITKEELRDFSRFADERLERGEAASLVELAGEWEAQRDAGKQSASHGNPMMLEIDAATAEVLRAAFPEKLDDQKLQEALARRDGITTAQLLARAAAAGEKAASK